MGGTHIVGDPNGPDGSQIASVVKDGTTRRALVVLVAAGAGANDLGKAEDAAHTSGDRGVMLLGVRNDALVAFSDTDLDYTPIAVSSAGALSIQGGNIAHDGVDSGRPVKVGAKAANALPAAVANLDRADNLSDLWGRQLTAHIDPAMQTWKSFNATTTQAGTDVWTPASGKRIAITSIEIGTYGTTAGRVILWFGDNADTTYTEGTDQPAFKASFAPSATVRPGAVYTPASPIFCTVADRELHITTDADISIDVVVYGYEY